MNSIWVNRFSLPGLIPPSVPPPPKPPGIKPPAHWLIASEQNKHAHKEDISSDKEGIYEDLKQFFNSASASSVVSNCPVLVFILFSKIIFCKWIIFIIGALGWLISFFFSAYVFFLLD